MVFQTADDPRHQRLELRVTPAEKLMIQNAAAARGCSVSEFIVRRALQRSGFSYGEWGALRGLRGILETLQDLVAHPDEQSVEQLKRILSGITEELENVWQPRPTLPLPEAAGE
ncbi:plasmid mobilization protein [Paraburkholderia strydomiana]|uniref:plasmid mobilization protein n=1 Tax=Paraburkholderia strydomiana TaxID=1245417 RepID=UPI0038BD57B0